MLFTHTTRPSSGLLQDVYQDSSAKVKLDKEVKNEDKTGEMRIPRKLFTALLKEMLKNLGESGEVDGEFMTVARKKPIDSQEMLQQSADSTISGLKLAGLV